MIFWFRYTINGWLWHTVFSAFFHQSRKSFEQQSIKGNSNSCYSYPIIQLLSLQNSGNGWKRRSSSFSSVWSSICKSTKVPTYGILYKKPGPLLLEQKTLSNLILYLLRKGIIILLFVCVLRGVFVSVKKCAGSNGSISSVRAAVSTCQSLTTPNDEIHAAKQWS